MICYVYVGRVHKASISKRIVSGFASTGTERTRRAARAADAESRHWSDSECRSGRGPVQSSSEPAYGPSGPNCEATNGDLSFLTFLFIPMKLSELSVKENMVM